MADFDTSYLSAFFLVIICMVGLAVGFSFAGQIINAIFNPSNPFIIKGLISGNGGTKIFAAEDIPIVRSENQSGIEFSYSVWINIANLDTSVGKFKHVFSKGDNVSDPNTVDKLLGLNYPNNSPGLYIAPDSNALVVYMNTFNEISETATVSDVPMNKWLHVVIRVQQKYLDVYVNGTLVKRTLLTSLPKQNYGNVYVTLGDGFNGNLSNLQYFDYALQPGAIMGLSAAGPNLSPNDANAYMKNVPPALSMQWYFENTVKN